MAGESLIYIYIYTQFICNAVVVFAFLRNGRHFNRLKASRQRQICKSTCATFPTTSFNTWNSLIAVKWLLTEQSATEWSNNNERKKIIKQENGRFNRFLFSVVSLNWIIHKISLNMTMYVCVCEWVRGFEMTPRGIVHRLVGFTVECIKKPQNGKMNRPIIQRTNIGCHFEHEHWTNFFFAISGFNVCAQAHDSFICPLNCAKPHSDIYT